MVVLPGQKAKQRRVNCSLGTISTYQQQPVQHLEIEQVGQVKYEFLTSCTDRERASSKVNYKIISTFYCLSPRNVPTNMDNEIVKICYNTKFFK